MNWKSFPAFPLPPLFPLHLKYLLHGKELQFYQGIIISPQTITNILYCILGTYSNIICNILLIVYLMACSLNCKSFPAFPLSPLFPLHLKYFSTGLIIIHITKMAEKAGPIRNSCSLSIRSYFCVPTVDKTTWHKRIMLCFNANSCLKHQLICLWTSKKVISQPIKINMIFKAFKVKGTEILGNGHHHIIIIIIIIIIVIIISSSSSSSS